MSLETNILRYLANCLERRMDLDEGGVTMTSPTQPQEKYVGFDAMAGLPSGRYALLQFKRPSVNTDSMRFTIEGDQLYALLRCPPRSAFYVLPPIDSNRDMWEAKASLLGRSRLVDAWDFLAALVPSKPATPCCLLASAWSGPADWPRTHTVHVGLHGGATRICARLPGEKYRKVYQRSVSCLCCDRDGLGFFVAGGKVRAWNGMEWSGIGRSCSAEDAHAQAGVLDEWLAIGCSGKRSARGAVPDGQASGASARHGHAAPPRGELRGEDRRRPDLPLPGGRDMLPHDELDDERRSRGRGGANGRGGPVAVRIGDVS